MLGGNPHDPRAAGDVLGLSAALVRTEASGLNFQIFSLDI